MSWDPVYRLVKQIPRGRVITYGDVARFLRLPGGAVKHRREGGRAASISVGFDVGMCHDHLSTHTMTELQRRIRDVLRAG